MFARFTRAITKLKQTIERMVSNMAIIYATLIIEGKKTFKCVPARIKDKVRQVLIDLGCEDLAKEEE